MSEKLHGVGCNVLSANGGGDGKGVPREVLGGSGCPERNGGQEAAQGRVDLAWKEGNNDKNKSKQGER